MMQIQVLEHSSVLSLLPNELMFEIFQLASLALPPADPPVAVVNLTTLATVTTAPSTSTATLPPSGTNTTTTSTTSTATRSKKARRKRCDVM